MSNDPQLITTQNEPIYWSEPGGDTTINNLIKKLIKSDGRNKNKL